MLLDRGPLWSRKQPSFAAGSTTKSGQIQTCDLRNKMSLVSFITSLSSIRTKSAYCRVLRQLAPNSKFGQTCSRSVSCSATAFGSKMVARRSAFVRPHLGCANFSILLLGPPPLGATSIGRMAPRERHVQLQHLKLFYFLPSNIPPSKSGTFNIRHLSFAKPPRDFQWRQGEDFLFCRGVFAQLSSTVTLPRRTMSSGLASRLASPGRCGRRRVLDKVGNQQSQLIERWNIHEQRYVTADFLFADLESDV